MIENNLVYYDLDLYSVLMFRMYKVLFPLLCFVCLSSIDAAGIHSSSTNINNNKVRVGLEIGLGCTTFDAKLNGDYSSWGKALNERKFHVHRTFHINSALEVGRRLGHKGYVGLVFGVNYLFNKQNDTKGSFDYRGVLCDNLTFKNSLDAAAKFGYFVRKDVMLYGKTGLSFARWRHITGIFGNNAFYDVFAVDKSVPGLILGLGVENRLNNSWTVGIDCTLNVYSSIRVTKNNASFKRVIPLLKDNGDIEAFTIPRKGSIHKSVKPTAGAVSLKLTHWF